MLLLVDGTNKGILCRDISLWVTNHESAFDLLNHLIRDGWVLKRATVIDGFDRVQLPIQAFDGQSVAAHMATMQHQWQQILARRSTDYKLKTSSTLLTWMHQLDAYYADLIQHLQKMGVLLEAGQAGMDERIRNTFAPELNAQIDSLIRMNRRMYREARRSQQKNRNRLRKIDHS